MLGFWQHWLNPFLNSSFFLSLTTVVVAAFALYIYKRQRKDEVRDAATILLAEINNSSVLLRGVKERFNPDPSQAVLESNVILEQESWSKYKYLFINILEPEEWEAVNNFYKYTSLYDEAVRLNNSYFDSNTRQTWVSLHAYYLDRLKEFHKNNPTEKTIDDGLRTDLIEFSDLYINNQFSVGYSPRKPINDAKYALENLNLNLATSTVFVKLRELAFPRHFWHKKNKR